MTISHTTRSASATAAETSGLPGERSADRGYRTGFRPDVEGLRAVAVLTVLAFHADLPFARGGFVGVDVFFVISGFLITGLMAAEVTSTGWLDLAAFYARRARRILPSAALVLVASAVAGWLLLPLLAVQDMARDLVAAALYVANWRFIAQGTNYLAPSSDHSPFLHYWSLAVEEQYYLVWPVLALAVAWSVRRRGGSPREVVAPLALLLVLLTGLSLAHSLQATSETPESAYLGTPARAWQFGLGALLALAAPALRRTLGTQAGRGLGVALGWGGLTAVLAATWAFDEFTPYPGTAALVPTLGTLAIVLSGVVAGVGGGSVGRLLALAPVRAVGRVSFAWYLWHWPVLVFGEAVLGNVGPAEKTALVMASLVPSVLGMWAVERPIRFSRLIGVRSSSGLAIGATATVAALATGLALGAQSLQRLGDVDIAASAPTLAKVFGADTRSSAASGPVSPSPLKARADRPGPDSCLLQASDTVSPECRFGPVGGKTVVLFGDSHAQQWLSAVTDIGKARNWSIVVLTKSGCPAPQITPRQDHSLFSMPECATWRENSLQRIQSLKPSLILVSSLHNYIPDSGERLTAWNRTLDRLRTTGAPIAYLADTPWPGKDIPVCMSGALDTWAKCSFPRSAAMDRDPVIVEALAGRQQHLSVLDLTNYLCPEAVCPAAKAGTLFYRDDSHITATLAHVLAPALEQAMVTAKLLTAAPAGEGGGAAAGADK